MTRRADLAIGALYLAVFALIAAVVYGSPLWIAAVFWIVEELV